MKSKRRHHSSSEESEDSEGSVQSSSTDSESEESSASEHRHKKKKKRADSSESDSDSDDHRRSKRRKHKKKKKKHVKRKRRSASGARSGSEEDDHSSISDGEVSAKKKRKKLKHKRSRSSSASVIEVHSEHTERRLHSVVKERRRSSEEDVRPTRTYYQKEYRSNSPIHEYKQREREVQRFYRGSSKERRIQEQYHNEQRERHERNRYESHRPPPEEYQRRPREDAYHAREQPKGFNRPNHYEERGPKRNYEEGREFRERERRGPPEPERFREREFPDRRERYREEPYHADRRDPGRDKPPPRVERPPPVRQRTEEMRTHSQEDRPRERGRRPEPREREPREPREPRDHREPREHRDDRDRRPPPRDDKPDRNDHKMRDRKSRFTEAENDKEYSWGKTEVKKEAQDGDKEKPNFGLSGKLTADANTVNGVVIKYTEPDDAKQPKRRWRFYPFKGDKALPILYIHRQSAFLIGRDKKVADISLEHPSISKQHAALQFRATPFTRPDGSTGRRVRPYVIDLESANGTFVNNKKIEPRRYVELLEKDVVKFGFSLREYVLLHENSKDDAQDDDNQDPPDIGATVVTTDQIKMDKRVKQEVAEDGE